MVSNIFTFTVIDTETPEPKKDKLGNQGALSKLRRSTQQSNNEIPIDRAWDIHEYQQELFNEHYGVIGGTTIFSPIKYQYEDEEPAVLMDLDENLNYLCESQNNVSFKEDYCEPLLSEISHAQESGFFMTFTKKEEKIGADFLFEFELFDRIYLKYGYTPD